MRRTPTTRARVVIDAGWGDGGKGLMTDYYAAAARGTPLVVRFNGGAQAGHTVVLPDGRRHVFKHFGAGTFVGGHTLLTRHFLLNPILFWREAKALANLGVIEAQRFAIIDPTALVTTPYDMLLNQCAEEARGSGRHGSVGLGINETVTRSEQALFRLIASDLTSEDYTREILSRIATDWVPRRAAELGCTEQVDRRMTHDITRTFLNRWVEEARLMVLTRLCGESDTGILRAAADRGRPIIFEGAQGLGLDEQFGTFPHVTRSRTGLANAVAIVSEANLDIDVTYVTRCYATRHGAGPLPREDHSGIMNRWIQINDPTNQPHDYQGTLRAAPHDLQQMTERIACDLTDSRGRVGSLTLAVTCFDQILDDRLVWWDDTGSYGGTAEDFLFQFRECVNGAIDGLSVDTLMRSDGPTRDHVSREWAHRRIRETER